MLPIARLVTCCLVLVGLHATPAWSAEDNANNDRWQAIRKSLFADRVISDESAGIVSLETPQRAADASVVPIAIRSQMAQSSSRYIQKIYLVIDSNPSPVGATFTFTPESGKADIETRVRIEEYTNIRAIAELSDGRLVMATKYIKASGGCSAPAGKDMVEAMANVGRMKLRVDGDVEPGKPALAQLMVSHPNISGLSIDQVTRLAPSPYYVRSINVTYGGKPVMSADVDFTISENPSVRFYFVPGATGELRAQVVDSHDRSFEAGVPVSASKAQAKL